MAIWYSWPGILTKRYIRFNHRQSWDSLRLSTNNYLFKKKLLFWMHYRIHWPGEVRNWNALKSWNWKLNLSKPWLKCILTERITVIRFEWESFFFFLHEYRSIHELCRWVVFGFLSGNLSSFICLIFLFFSINLEEVEALNRGAGFFAKC